MTTSREIKKALNRAFKGVKFTARTENVSYETVTINWVGGPFINQVQEITDAWHTYKNHSDSMVDYFHFTGTKIELNRELSQDEIDFVVPGIFSLNGRIIDDLEIVFDSASKSFVVPEHPYKYRFIKQNESLKAYSENGMAVELNSREAEKMKNDHLFATDREAWMVQYEQKEQARKDEELVRLKEAQAKLIQGDYSGSPANYNLNYIVIHWHEGVQTIAEDAKFSSFKSANNAIRKIYSHEDMEWGHEGYDKLKFSIHFTGGEVYDGRLYLSPTGDNPFTTDNVIGEHCVEFLKEQSDKSMLQTYKFEDIEPKPTPELFMPIEVDEPYEFVVPTIINYPQILPLQVDEPEIDQPAKAPAYTVINTIEIKPVPVPVPSLPTFKVIKTSPIPIEPIAWRIAG